jgi:enoyl-CoA hydratase/carnithine racemase
MDHARKEYVIASPLVDGVRFLTLDRADKANSLSSDLVDQLLGWIERSENEDCRTVVIAAKGKAFCGGFDFTGYETATHGDLLLRFTRIEQLLQRLRQSSFVSIALVQGAAMGAGADIAASCTYRVGSDPAKFRFPGFRFGVALGTGHLARLVGTQTARDILLNNTTIDAKAALEIGLLTDLIEPDGLRIRADEIIAQIGPLDRTVRNRILHLTSPQNNDTDLAELVRSVSAPGLHDRIARYRAGH